MDTCQVCLRECKARRCTNCLNAYYCSIACQTKDWKAGHRRICLSKRTKQEKADWALQQLVALTQKTSGDVIKEHHDKATDEVKRRQQKSLNTEKRRVMATSVLPRKDETPFLASSESTATIAQNQKSSLHFDVVVEDMKYISRFQITLHRKWNSTIKSVDLTKAELNFRIPSKGSTATTIEIMVETDFEIYSATLPRLLEERSARIQHLSDDVLQISVTYKEDPTLREMGTQSILVGLEEVNQIQCSSCHTPLLSGQPIKRTSELPTGHWDDIADYLICYSGVRQSILCSVMLCPITTSHTSTFLVHTQQPVVDFTISSITAEPSVALQDGNFLCLNYADIASTASVQPCAGYGDIDGDENSASEGIGKTMDVLVDPAASIRGERNWRDVTGGATVCCNNCSQPIGFASIEAPECFRLLKHRLSIPRDVPGKSSSSRRLSSCASFLAREMVRYAEAKAIFTFIVTLEGPRMSFATTVFTRCILLRLVSWDCNIATSFDDQDSLTDELCFRRFAKLVFEETYDKRTNKSGSWLWGGVDLCCPPLNIDVEEEETTDGAEEETTDGAEGLKDDPTPEVQKVSSTRIQLSEADYNSTLESLLQGRKLFTKDVADATILMKTGSIPHRKDENEVLAGLGFTAIPLQGHK